MAIMLMKHDHVVRTIKYEESKKERETFKVPSSGEIQKGEKLLHHVRTTV